MGFFWYNCVLSQHTRPKHQISDQYSLSAIHTHIEIDEYFLVKLNAVRFNPILLTIHTIISRGV